jgi:chromosome segregation ATPase
MELEQTQESLKQIKARVAALQSGRDKINQQKGLEQGKLDEAYRKLRELGIENPETMTGKELQALADSLGSQLQEQLGTLNAQLEQGEGLMEQYREIQQG